MTIALITLFVIALILLFRAYRFLRVGPGAVFRFLVLVNYTLIQPISGIVHLAEWGSSRGYFNLLNFPENHLMQSVSAAALGAVALIFGMGRPKRTAVTQTYVERLTRSESRIALTIILILGPVALYGLWQMNSIAASLGTARIIELQGGTARYSFLSHWFAFISILAAVVFVDKFGPKKPLVVLLALSSGFLAIIASLTWSGGRSVILLMALPLLFYAIPRMKGLRWLTLIAGGAAFLSYVVIVSQFRSDSLSAGAGVNLGNWLDWEWGRFSMSGLAVEFTERNGSLNGETFAAGLLFAVQPFAAFLGLSIPDFRTSMDVASRIFLGDFSLLYMVPGFTSELLMNFGLVGVFVGYFVLGRATQWVDLKAVQSRYLINKVFLYYLGSILVFRIMPSASAGFLVFLFYSGAPLIIAVGLSAMFKRTPAGTETVPAA